MANRLSEKALLQAAAHGKALDGDHSEMVVCSVCHDECAAKTAHLHQGEWIGDECCWDERLRSTE